MINRIPGILCILAVLIIYSDADRRNPLKDPQICGRPECETRNNKFIYSSTIRYKYDYRMHVRTEFLGSGENSSDIFVSASVILTFPKKCEGVLSIQDIELREIALPETNEESETETDYDAEYVEPLEIELHPNNEQFSGEIQRNDLRFSFHDGIIGEICPSEDDSNWVLNFKKGILSTIQNSMTRFDVDFNNTETDISGTCNVVYNLVGAEKTGLIIEKRKDIDSCINRYKTNSVLQTTPYDFRKNFAIWPVLQTTSTCNISVDHNIYQDVTCYERHQLVPFSNNQSGAVTETKIRLTLVDEERFEPSSYEEDLNIHTRSPLLFNHYPTPKPTHGEIKASRDLLKQMCRLGFPDIQRDFIDAFTKFLQTAKLLSHSALQQLLARASSICSNGKNHVLESLPYIGSTASVQIMRDQIVKNGVSSDVAYKWLASLTYLPRPDTEMLEAFQSLIEYGKTQVDPIYTLSPSAVAHTFCRNHPDCGRYNEINDIVDFLEADVREELGKDVHTRQVRDRIVVLLKALGNIGIINEPMIHDLRKLIKNETIPMNIRLQAIFVHRRLDCVSSRDFFLELYRNFDVNSEIRIACYLEAMRCPDYISIKNIKYVLKHEEVNQVGSFVWSHLTNLAKSASPVRVEAQGLLIDGDLGTKYKMDIRKFSRNFENSLFFDEYNFGANIDTNLIFGTESYMPRAVSLNFTADLFGESVNFFEISTRMQGFEHLIESVFGPKGPLNTQKFRNKFDIITQYFKSSANTDDNEYEDEYNNAKRKRDVSGISDDSDESDNQPNQKSIQLSSLDSKEQLKKNVDDLNYKLKYNFNQPSAAFGLKMFGNDIYYKTMEGTNEMFMTLSQMNPINQLKEIFSGKEITYTKSGVFLDASYDVPLCSGLPLSIHAFGASSVDLRMSGSLKADNLFKKRHLDIEGKLKPSISVDIIGSMQTDYFYGSSGIRVKSNLYSSSSIDAMLKLRGSKLASLQFSLPQDRNDLFSARSELLVLKHEKVIQQTGIPKRYSNSTCTWPFIDRAVGLKICAEYSLPDMSNATNVYPSLLLSGPINLNIYLDKADLTAKTFLFEYRWDDYGNMSRGSFVFLTPNTVIPRIFSANVTTDPYSYNISMAFKNGDIVHSAVGTYKNTEDQKKIEMYFNLDGHKNLALEMEMNRSEVRHGWMYFPKMLLAVNDERIAGVAGTIKVAGKKGIVQYDVNLTFETKRLQTKLGGYIIHTEASVSTKLKMDYMFLDNKIESIEIDGELANRSQKSRTEYVGSLKVNSSAYPHFNFASNLSLLSLLGHIETKIDVNNAVDLTDPNYTTTVRLKFARVHTEDKQLDGSSTEASFEVTRPKSNVNLQFMIRHEEKFKKGLEHNIRAVVQLAKAKKGTAVLSILFPRGPLFGIDAMMNITIPTFDPCVILLRLNEKSSKEYMIDFKGTIFSGHSMLIKGLYQDKSSLVKSYHHFKIVAKSPYFEETNIDLKYSRDEAELIFNLQVDYAKELYGLLLKHSEREENMKISFAEIKFQDKLYSISANLMTEQPKQLIVEVHLDRFRDIHLILKSLSTDFKKETRIEIKWDANRDPTEKLAISAEFNTPNYKTYDGNFLITYPERTLSGTFDLFSAGPEYKGAAYVGWSSYESIAIKFDAGSKIGDAKDMWISVKVNTPFDGWRTNNANAGFYYLNNLLLANGSLLWAENQKIALGLMGDYEINDPEYNFEVKLGLNSTIKDVPSAGALIRHKFNGKKLETDIHIKHTPFDEQPNIFSVRSSWHFDTNYRKVNGSVVLRSPFQGYRTGAFTTKYTLSNTKELYGAASLDIEKKRYTLSVAGHAKKLTDNMFVTNITTPIEKFRNIVGRFGINERERHVVAEVRGPNGALGVELLFSVVSNSDFDVKFNLETPIEAFEKVMLIGKMNSETVEFKGGWNKIIMGYVGVWRMVSFTDFEYSYKVFTPLENLKETGFVAKFVRKKEFDLELSIKFAQYKMGIIVNAKPKPKFIRLISIQQIDELKSALLDEVKLFQSESDDTSSEDDDTDDDDDEELLNMVGNMELDTLIWPTIIGTLDFEEIADTCLAIGTLKTPHGIIEFRDILYYPDYFNIKNSLSIYTPYIMIKELKSVYIHSVELQAYYIFGLEFAALNNINWIEVGGSVNYTITKEEAEPTTYDISVALKTPMELLPIIHFKGNIELEQSIYRANISAKTQETDISFGLSLESDENFVDASFGLSLDTPVVPMYALKFYFKKDLSDVENSVELGFDVNDNQTFNMLRVETMWHSDSSHYLRARGKVNTNLLPVTLAETYVLLTKTPNPTASIDFGYATFGDKLTEFHLRTTRKKELITIELITPIQEFGNVSFRGSLSNKATPGLFELMGTIYKNTDTYHVEGAVTLRSDIPVDIELKLKSLTRDSMGQLTFELKDTEGGYGKTFLLKLKEADKFLQIGGGLSIIHKLNWKLVMAIISSDGILTSKSGLNRIDLDTAISPDNDGTFNGKFELMTPWNHLGINSVKLGSEVKLTQSSGEIHNIYELPQIKGNSICSWSWIPLINMQISLGNMVEKKGKKPRQLRAGIKFTKKNRTNIGVLLDVDSLWQLETNGTLLFQSKDDIQVGLSVLLPQPFGNKHKLTGRFKNNSNQTDADTNVLTDISYEAKYEAVESKTRFSSSGQYKNFTNLEGIVRVGWGNDIREDVVETNVQMLREGVRREFLARVVTPMFIEDSLTASGSYDIRDIYNLMAGKVHYPASRQVANADVAFASFSNMKGFINCSTPFQNLTWLRGDFDFTSTGVQLIRYLKGTWPKDFAYFDLQSTYMSKNLDRDLQGTVQLEVPLATKHHANIVYGLKERQLVTTGHCVIDYNKSRVLNGQYTCKSENKAGFEKDVVDITIENEMKPIGITYVHVAEHSDIDGPHYDMKRAEIYELRKSKQFNITTELHIKTTLTGQAYKIVAIHPNRTVVFRSDYDFQDNITKQKSKLELASNIWIAYDLKLQNLTKMDNESQRFNIELSYPRRNLSAEGWYSVTDDTFDSDISFKWTKNQQSPNTDAFEDEYESSNSRIMRASVQWHNDPIEDNDYNNQSVLLSLRHPSFKKDITFKGFYSRNPIDLLKTKIIVDYCDDPDHLLTFETVTKDLSSILGYRNYSIEILGHHEVSELDLNMNGSIGIRPGLYELHSVANYKRSYLPLQEGSLDVVINIKAKEMYCWKISPHKTLRIWSKTNGNYPIYTFNASVEDSPDLNAESQFYINIEDKMIRLEVNMTPDGSQNLKMYGSVPDARYAYFDLYRDYEDIRVVDIAYYLRMNHSRLVTSQLIWRPKMKTELKTKLKSITTSFYDTLSEGIDFWIKTIYTESIDTINDVWNNAKPHTQEFLDDFSGLKVLEDDIKEFRVFLNQSYEANDFYVKTVVNYTMTLLDELSIRNHIDSVPKILNEIWQALGDSGQALHRSIIWFIDTIKTSYRKAVEMIGKLFHGEAMEYLSTLMEKGVAKYDKFMKDLHLSLIKYVENMWTKITDSIIAYWKRSLQRIEPSIIKFMHYLETVMWNMSKELLDFLYKRTNELVESPYFHKISNFTQDLDRLYTDIIGNDAVTNIRKYTALAWEFVKEEYFKVIPFGKELNEVLTELIEEIKTLEKLEAIQYFIQRINEVKSKAEWLIDEFRLESRLHQLWDVIKNKITRFTQTALQTDDQYREAKTKFIFDPDVGLIEFEQKLPMSWHAFNETPKFEEIPEYKMLNEIQEFFNVNNYTIWNFYYDFKPFTDPDRWLPPFKSYSLIVGSRHYMTFDKRFIFLNSKYSSIEPHRKPDQCSYLLAKDYFDSNFTLVVEPSIINHKDELISSRKLALITEDNILDIDTVGLTIRVGRNLSTTLPFQIGDMVIYRDANILRIESTKGFIINCNLLFDLCWLELSGWYFGKTAGLLGNMNNEIYDDYRTSGSMQSDNDETYLNSWSLETCKEENIQSAKNASLEVINICEGFFKSKISVFLNCFAVVNPLPFYDICLDLGTNSFASVISNAHPAQKGACTAALSYIEACDAERVLVRIPDTCIHCELINGTFVPEGNFVKLEGNDVPRTTDVVFIIEAKPCNKDIMTNKSMLAIINSLQHELVNANITNNRYAAVAFGGAAPFDYPRSIVYNNQIFTDYINIGRYLEHVKTGFSNNSDIFQALSMAFKLVFRPGASKTFILLPCSTCNSSDMKLDYSTILQVMLEEGINLHVLMDQDFVFGKKRIERMLFGVDRDSAYTKQYLKEQKGDKELKRRIPKIKLGLCVALAHESNGTVFSAKKLKPGGRNPIKKFAAVFAKRVALTAVPSSCQICECNGHNTGAAYMPCTHCTFPNPSNLDYGFNEDDMLLIMQSGADFNFDFDDEDDLV